jgi:hypothetical protein
MNTGVTNATTLGPLTHMSARLSGKIFMDSRGAFGAAFARARFEAGVRIRQQVLHAESLNEHAHRDQQSIDWKLNVYPVTDNHWVTRRRAGRV